MRALRRKYLILVIGFSVLSNFSAAQKNKTDSLWAAAARSKSDTVKIALLHELLAGIISSNPDSAIALSRQALALAQKLPSSGLQAVSLGYLGTANYYKGNYPAALNFYLQALKLNEAGGAVSRACSNLNNIGSIYYLLQDYSKSLEYYTRALRLNESQLEKVKKNGDVPGLRECRAVLATQLGNIANVYSASGAAEKDAATREQAYEKALEFYFRTLKLEEEGLEDAIRRDDPAAVRVHKNGMAVWFANIGVIFEMRFRKALAKDYGAEMYEKALDYYTRALKLDEELGDKNGMAIRLCNKGVLHLLVKNFSAAEVCLKKSLDLCRETGARDDERLAEEALAKLFAATGRHKEALAHYKYAMTLKDSLFNQEKQEEITRREMNFEFEKKQALAEAEYRQRQMDARSEIEKQKLLRNGFIGGFVLIFCFSIFIYRNYVQKRSLNVALEEKNNEIEAKIKDILDSIHYARRIQHSLLPSDQFIGRRLSQLRRGTMQTGQPSSNLPKL